MKQVMINDLYTITALSNMHVGSGDVNFGVIDNLIQRDTLNNYPNINSSGLKGAIREFFSCYYQGNGETEELREKSKEEAINFVFGSSPKSPKEKMQSGAFRFFEANMLSIPVRSNKASYLMATSKHVIRELKSKIEIFNISIETEELSNALDTILNLDVTKGSPVVFNNAYENALIEDTDFKSVRVNISTEQLALLEKLFGYPLVLLYDGDFRDICENSYLPVIARNNLEDGRSQNLWYEQVLPRATRLYFVLMKEEEYGEKLDKLFEKQILQIGGNASIGYGFSQIQSVTKLFKM